MRKRLLTALVVALLVGCPRPAAAEDEALALVKKAVAAQGGEEKLARQAGSITKMKGTIYALPQGDLAFTGEAATQPSGPVKITLEVTLPGQTINVTQVLDGDKGWASNNGQVTDLDDHTRQELKKSQHVDRVTGLVPLLTDKGFTLSVLKEAKVNGRPAAGVKVEAKDQPDVSLWFDRESGLLVKYAYHDQDPLTMKEVLHETVLDDYREPDPAAADEAALKAAKAPTEGKALLELLAKKTPAGASDDRVKELIKQLGADDFKTREQAAAALVELGPVAVPLLKRSARDPDLEVAKRAQECLDKIGDREGDSLVYPAIRLVALRRPDGAVEALLDVLARTRDEDVQREALAALVVLADAAGKPDPALAKALEDKDPARRAAAAAVLGKDGGAYLKKAGRRLVLTGVKLPMKFESFTDGKKNMSRDVTEVQFFNRLDDGVFARPK
jgi:hypothetical protein